MKNMQTFRESSNKLHVMRVISCLQANVLCFLTLCMMKEGRNERRVYVYTSYSTRGLVRAFGGGDTFNSTLAHVLLCVAR